MVFYLSKKSCCFLTLSSNPVSVGSLPYYALEGCGKSPRDFHHNSWVSGCTQILWLQTHPTGCVLQDKLGITRVLVHTVVRARWYTFSGSSHSMNPAACVLNLFHPSRSKVSALFPLTLIKSRDKTLTNCVQLAFNL